MNVKETLLNLAEKKLSKYFPVEPIKSLGYTRQTCKLCGKKFWSLKKREKCGEHDLYGFIEEKVTEKVLSYEEVWNNFYKFLEKKGYLPIKRYPVVARWRDDLEFVIASIADFQPWVTKGIVEPPSKKLTVPQFCLRFNDVENVGFTGRHYTGFVMIGQHAFVPPEEYDINQYFVDLFEWFTKSLKVPEEEIILHEDVWAGGGNAGTCIEFFVRGLEVANQVYMQFETFNDRIEELKKIKVLDMGMGQERVAWLLNGTPTSYDVVFPETIKFLKKKLKEDIDFSLLKKVAPYYNSFDFEKISIQEFVNEVSKKLREDISKLVTVSGALYSICDHARTLLIAISDGCIPSNIRGGYNLRLILRRMYNFLEKYFEDVDIYELFEKVTEDWYEKELKENLEEVVDIVTYEINKYKETKRKANRILTKYIKEKTISSEELLTLYTSHGITPEMIKDFVPDFELPKDFYKKLEEFRERSKPKKEEKKVVLDVSSFPETEKMFYTNWKKTNLEATYLGKVDDYLVFDRTIFYPTKGGQLHDTGYIYLKSDPKNKVKVIEVIEVNNVILHKVEKDVDWEPNSKVVMVVDKERRESLVRHHTATHILTGVLRKLYGKHIWQAGAEKTPEKARLDVTHYKLPTEEELKKIEQMSNEIVFEGRKINKFYLRRDEAEKKYGFTIYQGGFIPEVNLRIVEIEDHDVEACSGLHVDNTLEVGPIKIVNVERIADGVIRFEFVAGKRVLDYIYENERIISELTSLTKTSKEYLPKVVKSYICERDNLKKKYTKVLEDFVRGLLKDGILKAKVSVESKDIIPILIRSSNKIKELQLETVDAILTTEKPSEGKYKKIGKFYLVFK